MARGLRFSGGRTDWSRHADGSRSSATAAAWEKLLRGAVEGRADCAEPTGKKDTVRYWTARCLVYGTWDASIIAHDVNPCSCRWRRSISVPAP
jgi:hypothetical protein